MIGLKLRLVGFIIVAVVSIGLMAADAFADQAIDVNKGLWFDHKYGGNPVISPNDGSPGIDNLGTAWGYFMTNGPNDYRMYYTGIDDGGDYDICLATSTDRINWTRSTSGIGGTHKVIDDGSAWAGPVWKENGTYHMIYKKNLSGYKWFHVTSADGISWGPSDMYTGTLGTEISSLMKIGDTYHAWGSTGSPAKVYHFASTDLDRWVVQNGGLPVIELSDSNVICPDVFYNVDTAKFYATAAVTPSAAGAPEKYYGTFRMWEASDVNFQTILEERDLLICNEDTLPYMEDWENGGNYDGQHFIWSDVYKQVHNSDELFFYYSAEDTMDSVYNFSMGLVHYNSVGAALSAPEPSTLISILAGAFFTSALVLRKRYGDRTR